MKEDMYDYFDGEKESLVSDGITLAKIMNATRDNPDSLDVKRDADRIEEIVRDVFKMSQNASQKDCVRIWQVFLDYMYARGITEE